MTPKPPTSITIGPHTYSVDTSPEAATRLRAEAKCGDSHRDIQQIRVDTEGAHTATAETMLHEALHMCWSQAALSELGDGLADREEHIIATLSPLLLHLLRANPTLVAYLTAP